jgi:hypothetical protein
VQLLLGDATCSAVGNLRVFRVCLLRAGAAVGVSAEATVSGAAILIVHGIDSEGCHLPRPCALSMSTFCVSLAVTHVRCDQGVNVGVYSKSLQRDNQHPAYHSNKLVLHDDGGFALTNSRWSTVHILTCRDVKHLTHRAATSASFQYSRHEGDVYLLAPISDVRLELTSSSVYLDEFPGLFKHHVTPFAEPINLLSTWLRSRCCSPVAPFNCVEDRSLPDSEYLPSSLLPHLRLAGPCLISGCCMFVCRSRRDRNASKQCSVVGCVYRHLTTM